MIPSSGVYVMKKAGKSLALTKQSVAPRPAQFLTSRQKDAIFMGSDGIGPAHLLQGGNHEEAVYWCICGDGAGCIGV